jgi:transketolase
MKPEVHGEGYRLRFGEADVLRSGKDVTIITSGLIAEEAVRAAAVLEAAGIDAELLNIHTIKPIDAKGILASARKTGVIVTVENHNVLGGLRAAVAEVVTEHYPVRIYPLGVMDRKGEVGEWPYLKDHFRISSKHIAEAAKSAVRGKGGKA